MPTTPFAAAGIRIEPPPSVPTFSGTSPAAAATAAPPLEPPAMRSRSHAFGVSPNSGARVKGLWPNSGVVVLPIMIAPASRKRATATASVSGTLCSKISEPIVVRTPRVLTRSLTENGTPCSGPRSSPRATASSARRASAIASSRATVMKAFRTGCDASIRLSAASVISTGEIRRERTSSASSVAGVYAIPSDDNEYPSPGIGNGHAPGHCTIPKKDLPHVRRYANPDFGLIGLPACRIPF